MEHHSHYFPKENAEELKMVAEASGFTGPSFVGQGLSKSVGSDCYGYYIVSLKKLRNGKTLVGICSAKTQMHSTWEEGSEDCALPGDGDDPSEVKADCWIINSGKNKNGSPKWYYCNELGKKFNGQHAYFRWNGSSAYRDPSF